MTQWDAEAYQARFDRLAASGRSVHGEADFCAELVGPGSRVLDAGCGTGRVGIELSRRGYTVVGVDVDAGMLAKARSLAPGLTWLEADLASFTTEERFDLVVCAGNVIPLVTPGSEQAALSNLARAGGLLVTGFGLDAAHLPLAEAPFTLAEYDAWCAAAGLVLRARYATWDGKAFEEGGGYVVSVHEAPAASD